VCVWAFSLSCSFVLQKRVKRIMNVSAGEKFSESGSVDEIDESHKRNKTALDQLKKYCNLTAGLEGKLSIATVQ